MLLNCLSELSHWIWVAVTIELELPQLGEVFDSGKSLHGGKRPDNHLELRSRSSIKTDVGDVNALDDQRLEMLEFFYLEAELALGV